MVWIREKGLFAGRSRRDAKLNSGWRRAAVASLACLNRGSQRCVSRRSGRRRFFDISRAGER